VPSFANELSRRSQKIRQKKKKKNPKEGFLFYSFFLDRRKVSQRVAAEDGGGRWRMVVAMNA
jgi:hypothetical protein